MCPNTEVFHFLVFWSSPVDVVEEGESAGPRTPLPYTV